MPLTGRVVWITGASSGIGAEVALELARRGARVVVTARRAEALEELAGRSANITAAAGDITDHDGIAAVVEGIIASHGGIDLALLNAGTYRPVLPEDFSAELFRPHIEVNIMGTVNCIEAVLPHMRARALPHLPHKVPRVSGRLKRRKLYIT